MGGLLKTYLLLICILAYLSANDAASVDNQVNEEKISVDDEEIETSDREKRWAAGCHPRCNSHSYCSSHGVCICKPGCSYVHGICQPNSVLHLGTITHNHHHHHHGNIGIIGSPPIRIVRPSPGGGGSSSDSSSNKRKRRRNRRRRYRKRRKGGSSSK